MAFPGDSFATADPARWLAARKGDPPGGTTGRVGCGTGWMRRPCRTQIHERKHFQSKRSSVCSLENASQTETKLSRSIFSISISTAGTHAAHVVAVSVELADPAAAAIAVVVVAVVAGGDRAADNRGADETGSNAPAPAERLGLTWVVVDAIVPVTASATRPSAAILVLIDMRNSIRLKRPLWSACPVGRRLVDSGSKRAPGFRIDYYSSVNTVT